MNPASEVDDLPWAVRGVMAALGIQYLKLRTFGVNPGTLEPAEADAFMSEQPGPGQTPARDLAEELVSSRH